MLNVDQAHPVACPPEPHSSTMLLWHAVAMVANIKLWGTHQPGPPLGTLKDHPGGVLAIITFAGKDASEEFNMIHPPDVIGKYAPDAVIGNLGAGFGF